MTYDRRLAGLKGAAKNRQRASAANYSDIENFMLGLGGYNHEAAAAHIIAFQIWHQENAAKARRLLWKILANKRVQND